MVDPCYGLVVLFLFRWCHRGDERKGGWGFLIDGLMDYGSCNRGVLWRFCKGWGGMF